LYVLNALYIRALTISIILLFSVPVLTILTCVTYHATALDIADCYLIYVFNLVHFILMKKAKITSTVLRMFY